MKHFFLTIDLEEWYHLEYLKPYSASIGSNQRYIPLILPFFDQLNQNGIKATVFVVGDIAQENKHVIQEIAKAGHEIACHSNHHKLVYEMGDEEFRDDIINAKKILEDICGKEILGYRAPCFSMDNKKLDILYECGFKYDASLIRFSEHELYRVLDMSCFNKIDSLVFEKDGHYEFETPTLETFGKLLPISGGGYFRLFPKWLMNNLINRYMKSEHNFIFYVHPFELSDNDLDGLKQTGVKNWIRYEVGRKGNSKKLLKFAMRLKKAGFCFTTIFEYLNEGAQ